MQAFAVRRLLNSYSTHIELNRKTLLIVYNFVLEICNYVVEQWARNLWLTNTWFNDTKFLGNCLQLIRKVSTFVILKFIYDKQRELFELEGKLWKKFKFEQLHMQFVGVRTVEVSNSEFMEIDLKKGGKMGTLVQTTSPVVEVESSVNCWFFIKSLTYFLPKWVEFSFSKLIF